MVRVFRYTVAGALGAVTAWAVMEPTALMPDVEIRISYTSIFVIGLVSGLLIGLFLGLAEGIGSLSPREATRCAAGGALLGAAGGILGLTFGNAFYNAMCIAAGGHPSGPSLPANVPPQARPASTPGLLSFLLLLIGRGFGWALIGGFIGLSQGIATTSTKKMVNGAVGGLIGGALGGSVFEILAWLNRGATNFLPGMIRFISFAITGGSIGLFIGFVEELARKAWLIRLVGRNEGKEYTIHKPITTIGRDEYADIPIFSDPDVAEKHAIIAAQGQRHVIQDAGSPYGTSVNGSKISREALRDGDTIEIGKTRFLFRDKATAKYSQREPDYAGAEVNIPTSEHVCPFCGSVKDANGNCECSVGVSTAPEPSAGGVASQPTAQEPWQADVGPQPQAAEPDAQQPGPAGALGASVTALSGPYAGKTYPLGGQVEIGREAGKDIPLSMDNTVSRNHARVAQEVTAYVIYDEGSTNGTFVNGQRIQRQELKPGDVVQIGSTKFRFDA